MLIEHPLNVTAAAEKIGIHRRTLSRWLQSEGTSFKRIADEVRFGAAMQLLRDTNMSLAEISAALRFSEPAAFTHAFRRWTGTTPSAWREKLL
jgi:AraC-like DNA-binding protein